MRRRGTGLGPRDHAAARADAEGAHPRRQRARTRLDVRGAPAHLGRPRSLAAARGERGAGVNNAARRLVARLVAIQVAAWGVKELLVAIFAPRLLLLEPSVVAANVAPLALELAGDRRARRDGDGARREPGAAAAPRAHGRRVPRRAARRARASTTRPGTWSRSISSGRSSSPASTLVAPLRPETSDLYTQVELALLSLTMASVAALPAYVMMRASVAQRARARARWPPPARPSSCSERASRGMARVRRRLLAAVVAPVAFVALGASLLVHAHLRAFDTSSRQNDAAELAQGVLDAVDGDTRGRKEAIEAAQAYGFDVDLSRLPRALLGHADRRGPDRARRPPRPRATRPSSSRRRG